MKRIALLTATALTAGALVAPNAAAATGDLTGGTFAWPIKDSFLSHLQGPIARGTLRGFEGAEFTHNQFVFPVDVARTTLDAQGNGTIALDGAIDIEAYASLGANGGPGLDVSYSDLSIEVQGTSATLSGAYSMAGDPGDKDNPTSATGKAALVTFELKERITPGHDSVSMDRVTTAGPGLEASLLRYKAGDVLKDGQVDLVLDYEDGQTPGAVTGNPLQGIDKLSSEVASVSSKNPSATGIAAVVGLVAGVLALIGGGAYFVTQIAPGLLGKLDVRAELAKLGITL